MVLIQDMHVLHCVYVTVETDSQVSVIPLVEILIGVSSNGDSDPLFKGCNHSFHWGKLIRVSTSGIISSSGP